LDVSSSVEAPHICTGAPAAFACAGAAAEGDDDNGDAAWHTTFINAAPPNSMMQGILPGGLASKFPAPHTFSVRCWTYVNRNFANLAAAPINTTTNIYFGGITRFSATANRTASTPIPASISYNYVNAMGTMTTRQMLAVEYLNVTARQVRLLLYLLLLFAHHWLCCLTPVFLCLCPLPLFSDPDIDQWRRGADHQGNRHAAAHPGYW
jgi:hypothetical protein